MHKILVTVISLAAIIPLMAGDYVLDVDSLEPGPQAPKIHKEALGRELEFSAQADSASAARIPQTFDFSHGGRIQLEYQDDEKQVNPYPRLLEGNNLSLHFHCDPKHRGGHKILKVLVSNPADNSYCQILLPSAYKDGQWHRLDMELDMEKKVLSLKLDGSSHKQIPLTVSPNLSAVRFILGANALRHARRGYNGRIRNVKITTPWTIAGAKAYAKTAVRESVGLRHVMVSHIKGRHLAFPGVTRLPSGALAVTFREGEGHVCPYGRICVSYSQDNGKNWSAPVTVSDTASDERDPSIQTLPDGRVLLSHGGWNSWMYYASEAQKYPSESNYIRQTGPQNYGGSRYLFSNDGGKSFGQPVKVPAFAPHGPYVDRDGTLYQPSLGNDNGKRQVYMYRGTPDGRSWKRIGKIAECEARPADVFPVYEEPHTVRLPDGRLLTAIRVPSDGYMRLSYSRDNGVTWSPVIKTSVQGFPQHLLVLRDGRLLVTYGYRYHPMGIRACISKDGGKTWDLDHEIILRANGGSGDLGYPVSIEMDHGEVFCVYYHNTRTIRECHIEGTFFKP